MMCICIPLLQRKRVISHKSMDWNIVKNDLPTTPAYVFDQNIIRKNLAELHSLKEQSGCKVLYSIKALPLELVLKEAKHYLDGFSVSSLFEARLAQEVLGGIGAVHITTPGIRDDEYSEIARLCTHISFNSITQYQRLQGVEVKQCSQGVRINPKLSFADDIRFDPCRLHSKLGVDIGFIEELPATVEGLHFHTVFSNTNYLSLEKTLERLKTKLGDRLNKLKWINLGGGYLYNQIQNHQPFVKLVQQLKVEYDLEVYIEPGKAVVGDAGYLVSTVIDCFNSDGKDIAVLDTSVNHNPEVFEYQRKPDVYAEQITGDYAYVLVGSSCLAGDLFGEYRFNNKLEVGDRIVFFNVGAYTLIKANQFNGYKLPDIYAFTKQNNMTLIKRNTYQNFRQLWAE